MPAFDNVSMGAFVVPVKIGAAEGGCIQGAVGLDCPGVPSISGTIGTSRLSDLWLYATIADITVFVHMGLC